MSGNGPGTSGQLVWTADQVPVGATVYLLDDTGQLKRGERGVLAPVVRLVGYGHSALAFYSTGHDGGRLGGGHTNIPATTRFTPVQTYTPANAVPGPEYAVFVHGRRYMMESNAVTVRKLPDGRIVFAHEGDTRLSARLPAGAVLVSISDNV